MRNLLLFAVALAFIGLGGYGLTGDATAMIPSALAIPVFIASVLASTPVRQQYATYVGIGVAIISMLAALTRLVSALAAGGAWSIATTSLVLLAAVSAAYLAAALFELRSNRQRGGQNL